MYRGSETRGYGGRSPEDREFGEGWYDTFAEEGRRPPRYGWWGDRGESPGLQGLDYGYGDISRRSGQREEEDFDPDYRYWRSEQMRKFDTDYNEWRNERRKKFSEDFDKWRSSRATTSEGSQKK
jgi:hypothetical protein